MSLFYRNQSLCMGAPDGHFRDLSDVLRGREGKACYVYDLNEILNRYDFLKRHLWSDPEQLAVHYAIKANPNPEVLRAFQRRGAGVDVVSGGEVKECLAAGFVGSKIIFSGVAKTHSEIEIALDAQVAQINVESPQELRRIGEISQKRGVSAQVAFRLNPQVNPVTHPYITTGMTENKFGMTEDFLPELLRILKEFPSLKLVGLTMHIGSQILQLDVFQEAMGILFAHYKDLQALGHPLRTLDIGGGVGIDYTTGEIDGDFQAIQDYASLVQSTLKGFCGQLLVEPGRILVGRSGVLLCTIEYIKASTHKNFAIVNSGMHHLLRPALYQAQHRILQVTKPQGDSAKKLYDVVGPICESSDFLGKDRMFQGLQQGDALAICDAGAYGFSMASNYNAHALPAEIVF